LRAVAGWLGLARQQQQPHRTRPAAPERKSWSQHERALLTAGDKMLARTRSEKQPLTLAVFDLSDLPELESVFGADTARDVMTQVGFRLQAMAGSRGLVIRTDATTVTVLMPGFDRERARQAIQRTMGSPCCIELDTGDHEIVLVPDFKVQTLGTDSASLAQVYTDMRKDIAAAQHLERRRQRYLQRERESHTRPMDLPAVQPPQPTPLAQPVFREIAPTIPAPLRR
jgi:GGDEF domain-containing protein